MYCPVRDVTLYKLPEYHSDEEDTTTKDSWVRTIEVTEPKAKRPKPDGETKPTKPPGGVMKPLTEQQRERVEEVIAAITKERTALDDVMK